jgi:hypothetical protein
MSDLGLNRANFRYLADEILKNGHKVRFQVSGESMQPFIQDGDILEIAPLAGKRIKPGEIMLVDAGSERLLVHRVIKTSHSEVYTEFLVKGDNSSSPDGWFRMENFLGRVEIVLRGGKHFNLSSFPHRLKSRFWVTISPWISSFSWLPLNFRNWIRRCFL